MKREILLRGFDNTRQMGLSGRCRLLQRLPYDNRVPRFDNGRASDFLDKEGSAPGIARSPNVESGAALDLNRDDIHAVELLVADG